MKKNEVVHEGVFCNVCEKEGPIRGVRFSCCTCPEITDNYELCEKHFLEIHKHHEIDHYFLEYHTPNKYINRPKHNGIFCSEPKCGDEMIGIRFKCMECENYELCELCYFQRLKNPNPTGFSRIYHPKHDFKGIISPRKGKEDIDVDGLEKCVSSTRLSSDPILIIVSFLKSPETFFNVCLSSMEIYEYFTKSEDPHYSSNVEFLFHPSMINTDSDGAEKPKLYPFVYRLTIISENFTIESLERFPNLSKLRLFDTKISSSTMPEETFSTKNMKPLSRIESLHIDGCLKVKSGFFDGFTNLKSLCIDDSHQITTPKESTELGNWVKNMKSLEKLVLINTNFGPKVEEKEDVVSVMENGNMNDLIRSINPLSLRKLKIINYGGYHWFCVGICRFENLEYLEVSGPMITASIDPFLKLKNLRVVVINGCICDQKEKIEKICRQNMKNLERIMIKPKVKRRIMGRMCF